MDHLLVPKDPVRSPPRIRYYCLEEHDRGDFITYPERQGWTQEELFTRTTWTEVDSVGGRGEDAAAAFLQQWLFFGLLHAIFGDDILFEEYIDEENGTKYIHTRNLLAHADQLVAKRDAGVVLEADMPSMDLILDTAHVAFDCICAEPGDALDPNFLLSLSLLGRFLLCLRRVLFQDDDFDSRGNTAIWECPPIRGYIDGIERERLSNGLSNHMSILTYEMVKEGWCPRIIDMLQSNALESRYFASLLRNPQKGRFDHKTCTVKQCFASQILKSDYQTTHTSSGCSCQFHALDPMALWAILEAGDLPLITWNLSNNALSLTSARSNTTYVAISHVWSDGLGNPHGNALPQCQLETISDMVQKLYPDDAEQVPFWIDTMCCPTRPPEARRTAIRKMRDTYANADKALVLDNTLRSINTAGRSTLEKSLYIYSSNWATRLWTLQEGALPRELVVQFSNETFNFREMLFAARDYDCSFESGWANAYDLDFLYIDLRGTTTTTEPPVEPAVFRLDFGLDTLSKRTTSVQDDETLCLASLVGMDPGPLLVGSVDDRMVRFWSQLADVGEDWMYYEHSRLDHVGFRWAPRSFLGANCHTSRRDALARPTVEGLLVNAYSVTLQSLDLPLSCPIGNCLWIRGTNGAWDFYLYKSPTTTRAQQYEHFTIPEGSFSRIALLMTRNLCDSGVRMTNRFVMVFVSGERDGVTYARRGDSGLIYTANHHSLRGSTLRRRLERRKRSLLAMEDPTVSRDGENYLVDDGYGAVVGDWTDEKSQWCID